MRAGRVRTGVRLSISLALLAWFTAHSGGWLKMSALDRLESYAYDARVTLTMPATLDPRVVIVDVDEKSLFAEGQWPWPRDKLARLVDQLFERYQIRALGIDFFFPEPDRFAGPVVGAAASASDRNLADAMRGRAVVTGLVFDDDPGQPRGGLPTPTITADAAAASGIGFVQARSYVGNLPELQSAAMAGGFMENPLLDADGVFRRVPLLEQYEGAVYPSLSLALAWAALGRPPIAFEFEPPEARGSLNLAFLRVGGLRIPVDGQVAVMVPYRGPQESFPYISATDVLSGKADSAVLREGSVVLFGTSAAGLYDLRVTPFSRAYAGVEIHANLFAGMLDGAIKQLAPFYAGIEFSLLLAIGLTFALLFPRLSALFGTLLAIGVMLAVIALAMSAWRSNFVMPLGVPLLFTLALFLAHLLYGFLIESRRSRQIARQFGEYVPREIVAEMAEDPHSATMESQAREMSVLFCDVRGFTTISEGLEPRELGRLMNFFFSALTRVIQKHRGTIDKYIGDAIMAFWGAPLADPEHARHALEAALEMIEAVRALDPEMKARGWPALRIGIGLNSGRMNVGNMGSEFRRAYTVMGDAVNLASRLEGLTKEYGVAILCGESTRLAAPDWAFCELDAVRVKGRHEAVAIYQPIGPLAQLDPVARRGMHQHQALLATYRAQRWEEAQALLEEHLPAARDRGDSSRLCELFLERIAWLRRNPPGTEWDGVFTFTHK